MRLRASAAFTAALIAAAALTPQAATAASGITLYVNGSDASCSNGGSGTVSVPFCSVQAAANVVNPGDVIDIEAGVYAPATITRSGTAAAPITITGSGGATLGNDPTAASGLTLSGVSHVNVEKLSAGKAADAEITINGGSDITVSHVEFPNTTALYALNVTGGASAVTVVDSLAYRPVLIDGGSAGTVFTTNEATQPIEVSGATNTAITSNSLSTCGSAISVTNSSTGTKIENNVVDDVRTSAVNSTCSSAQAYGILVDASSVPSTTSDYNDVNAVSGTADYDWNGAAYTGQSGFTSATGQGAHDMDGAGAVSIGEKSPIINSADSDAIGEQTTDIYGQARYLDPLVTPTGAGTYNYYDRGAYQFQDPLLLVSPSFSVSATKVPVGTVVDLAASTTDTWGDADLTYVYSISPSANATLIQPSASSGNATVTFSKPGSYAITVYVQSPKTGSLERSLRTNTVAVAPVAPLTSSFIVTRLIGTAVQVTDTSSDDWNVTGVSWNFGDNTGAVAGTPCCGDVDYTSYTYAKPGTYKITETVTDQDGNKATSTQSFTTMEVRRTRSSRLGGSGRRPEGPGITTPTATGVKKIGRHLHA